MRIIPTLKETIVNLISAKEEIASQVTKLVPYSHAWVLQLLPSEYKQPEKVEAGKVSVKVLEQKEAQISQQLPIPQPFQTSAPQTCSSCHIQTFFSRTKKSGDVLCSRCLESEWKKGTLKEEDLLTEDEAKTRIIVLTGETLILVLSQMLHQSIMWDFFFGKNEITTNYKRV